MAEGSNRLRSLALVLTAVVLATPGARADEYVEAVQAEAEILEDLLLDVGIHIFGPGLPEDDESALEKKGIYPDVRKSEARWIPFHLKDTLEHTANWGAVRVVPKNAGDVDVLVSGEILESTGLELAVRVRVEDVRGKVWREKRYKGEADSRAYGDDGGSHEIADPFQSIYNRIANDMLEVYDKLDPEDIREIREISRLKFAADLVPSAFGDYLEANRKGRVKIEKLPARDDPMIVRVAKIRERDYMFVDTLNEYYADFQLRMEGPYESWRQWSYEEQLNLRQIRRAARMRMIFGALMIVGGAYAGGDLGDAAVIGGSLVTTAAIKKRQEAKIHVEALKELAASFEAEIAPVLVEVEGQTLQLEGSAEAQFSEWRRMLSRIFATETGLPADPDSAAATSAAGTSSQ
jgi:hypothetical protein